MPLNRIESHPILPIPEKETLEFTWQGQKLTAKKDETIASALIANGIDIFGHHPKDGSPLGLFCANGQCSQCLVLLEGRPVKACMTPVQAGASIRPADGLPDISGLPANPISFTAEAPQKIKEVPVLIIGGGPAGLSAALELGQLGIPTLLVDDKSRLGGKLVLQTHRFFGSTHAVHAGTRGINIAGKLADDLTQYPSVEVGLNTTAIALYEDQVVGLWDANEDRYLTVRPQVLLVATGARERSLPFKGNTLPGIYGAGAFQTLVNRDLVRPAKDLFIVGGGNVGLIAGYHALQAGINVVGLVEALPRCGGYKVHEDKLARFNVPILTSHTILEAKGKDHVSSVVIAKVDQHFKPIPGTEREVACDCVLIAVGLNPVDEFLFKAQEVGLPVYAAGDAAEIAEASAAMFSGKIKGREIARYLGWDTPEIPQDWLTFESILKSKPGEVLGLDEGVRSGKAFPIMHCRQEIPCDPCASVCPKGLIRIDPKDIRHLPEFCELDDKNCIACERCVAVCPGLAITLVDFRRDQAEPLVSIPLEFSPDLVPVGEKVPVTDVDGQVLGRFPVDRVRSLREFSRTLIVRVKIPAALATHAAGIQIPSAWEPSAAESDHFLEKTPQENIVCRCEHVSADEIRALVRAGVRDINQIKAETKATMGACGGKTCLSLIKKIFREEGIPLEAVTDPPVRPVFVETTLSTLAGKVQKDSEK
jgi:NADPH-dependent 2,4-dienoyl-CoA reductase/sulfur reductase-like enzyme/Pyruvate/2-oxoacid:ferredoxin oxidoreductase delta subunit/bacterioferritin-associated ferredoxin